MRCRVLLLLPASLLLLRADFAIPILSFITARRTNRGAQQAHSDLSPTAQCSSCSFPLMRRRLVSIDFPIAHCQVGLHFPFDA